MSHKRNRLPKLRAAGDGTRILVKDYAKTLRLVPILPFAVTISIRAGFRTDGASIPVPLRRFIGNPFDTVRLIAAVCHDALYATHLVPRIVADFIYYLALRQCSHMPRAYAFTEYLALRARGKAAWNEKTPSDIAESRRLVRVRFIKGDIMKENKHTPVLDIIIFAVGVTLLCICSGCSTKTRNIDLDGMYVSEAGTLAVGSIEVMASPEGEESAAIRYAEDTAWLSPSTKTHEIKILLTGTNAVHSATSIVSSICAAFTATAPSLSPARTSANDSPIESGPYSNSPVVKKGDATGTAGEL